MNKKIKQKCQYNFSNCQKQAIGQHILKLGAVKIDKGWICGNCQQVIEKERKSKDFSNQAK